MLKSRKRKKCPPGCVKKPIRKVSRKRRSVKRKASRKVSRKRRSVKRKASRKRRSVKRKASRKRRSVKRKASRKMSRKRRSAKKKASRKRRSAKKKASRKRRSAKKKASRKRKSTKNKFRVKGRKPGKPGKPGKTTKKLIQELRKRQREQRLRAARPSTIMTVRAQRGRPTPITGRAQRGRPTPMTQRSVQEQLRRQQNSQQEQQWIQLNDAERKRILFAGDAGAVQRAQAAINAAVAAGKVDRYFANNWNAHILLGPDGKFRRPNPNDEDFFEEHEGHWGTQSADGDWGPKQEEAFQFLNRYLRPLGGPQDLGLYRYLDKGKKFLTTKVQITPYDGAHFKETRLVPTKCMHRTRENFLDKRYGECHVEDEEKYVVGQVREYEEM